MAVFYGVFYIATAVSAIIWLVSRYMKRNEDYWAKRGVPFAPCATIWDTYRKESNKAVHEINQEHYKKYGRIHGGFLFGKPVLFVSEPDLIKDIYVKDFHFFPTRTELSGLKIVDKGVTSLKIDDWKRVRPVITPAFTSRRMRTMGKIINECTKSLLETFDQCFERKEPVDCKRVFGAYAVDVVASVAFAMKIDSHKDPQNICIRHAKHFFFSFSNKKMYIKSILPEKIYNFIYPESLNALQFFEDVSRKVIRERKKTSKRFNDVLEVMMDALEEDRSDAVNQEHTNLLQDDVDQFGTIMNDKESYVIKNKKLYEDEFPAQCLIFFMTGYEPPTAIISYLSYCLALNPDWQEKVIKEVDEAFSKNTEMNHDSVQEMKILDAVLSETLRMFPSASKLKRICNQDYKLRNTNITIEKGIEVITNIYSMHYDPEYFDDPNTFNPERFMTSNLRHNKYAYLPFGAGPRNCLGMRFVLLEIKICIANVLRRYRFRKAPQTKVPLNYRKAFGLMIVDELPLAIEKRTVVPI